MRQVAIPTPFDEDLCRPSKLFLNSNYTEATPFVYYFDNNTVIGPLINATAVAQGGVSRVPQNASQNSTSFTFKADWQGVTSDGVPFWVEDDGVATAGASPTTFDQQVRIRDLCRRGELTQGRLGISVGTTRI